MSLRHLDAFSVSVLCRGSPAHRAPREPGAFMRAGENAFGSTSTELLLIQPYCWRGFIMGGLINVGQ